MGTALVIGGGLNLDAPRVWTQGQADVDLAVASSVRASLAAPGHRVVVVPSRGGRHGRDPFQDDGGAHWHFEPQR